MNFASEKGVYDYDRHNISRTLNIITLAEYKSPFYLATSSSFGPVPIFPMCPSHQSTVSSVQRGDGLPTDLHLSFLFYHSIMLIY